MSTVPTAVVPPPPGPFSVAAARGAAQLGRTVGVALADAELSPAAYRMLGYLDTEESAAKVLAAKLAVSRPTVTNTLDWLEPRGYVTRTPGVLDRRSVDISITDKGRQALADADRRVLERLANLTSHLDRTEIAAIVESLEVLLGALNAYRASTAPLPAGRAPAP
jgi:MarR family transcriptional regulator, lower aerobic nicotinate degradation pathway regulator